jgi:hypothetical protein
LLLALPVAAKPTCRPVRKRLIAICLTILCAVPTRSRGFVGQLLHREVPPKLIYQWADNGLLPVGKHGGRYLGSKRIIAAYFAATASGPSAATATTLRHSRRLQSVQRGRQPRRLRNEKRPLDITVSE